MVSETVSSPMIYGQDSISNAGSIPAASPNLKNYITMTLTLNNFERNLLQIALQDFIEFADDLLEQPGHKQWGQLIKSGAVDLLRRLE